MILLDTNILSVAVNPFAAPHVRAWPDAQQPGSSYLCTVAPAEARFGVALLPDGARKARIASSYDLVERQLFQGRVLSFDRDAAHEFALVRACRQRAGRRIRTTDALIAAIARAHSMTLATRNTGDFEDLELPLADPFEAQIP